MELLIIQFDDVSLHRSSAPADEHAGSLQRVECTTYSGPYYVAEYLHSNSSYDPCDRMRLADTCRADAAAKE